LLAKHTEKTPEQIEADVRRPKYFSPTEAVEYGIIDKVFSITRCFILSWSRLFTKQTKIYGLFAGVVQ